MLTVVGRSQRCSFQTSAKILYRRPQCAGSKTPKWTREMVKNEKRNEGRVAKMRRINKIFGLRRQIGTVHRVGYKIRNKTHAAVVTMQPRTNPSEQRSGTVDGENKTFQYDMNQGWATSSEGNDELINMVLGQPQPTRSMEHFHAPHLITCMQQGQRQCKL